MLEENVSSLSKLQLSSSIFRVIKHKHFHVKNMHYVKYINNNAVSKQTRMVTVNKRSTCVFKVLCKFEMHDGFDDNKYS